LPHLLDPKYQENGLTNAQFTYSYEIMGKLASHLKIENGNGEVLNNLGNFREHTGFFFIMFCGVLQKVINHAIGGKVCVALK